MNISPFLSGEKTKSLVIQVLSENWPLSMKRIHLAMKKGSRKSMTYQAVYKSVQELLADGVLSRQGSDYLISPVWVEHAGQFISRLSESYEKSNIGRSVKIQELNFNSLSEAWDFLLSRLNTDFFGNSAEAFVQIRRFFLFPISKADIERLREFFSRKKVCIMCRGDSIVDKLAAGFLRSWGAKVVTGIECARPTNVLINGDCVIHNFVLSVDDRQALTDYYKETGNVSASRILKPFGSIFFKKMKVRFLISRDPAILSDVLEQTKSILSKADIS